MFSGHSSCDSLLIGSFFGVLVRQQKFSFAACHLSRPLIGMPGHEQIEGFDGPGLARGIQFFLDCDFGIANRGHAGSALWHCQCPRSRLTETLKTVLFVNLCQKLDRIRSISQFSGPQVKRNATFRIFSEYLMYYPNGSPSKYIGPAGTACITRGEPEYNH